MNSGRIDINFSARINQKTLEIGCGAGRISSIISSEANLLVAIDPDEKAIKNASKNFSGVDFRIGSGETLNFPDSFFDVVIFTLSLHHQNSKKALSEATRVLKSGGKIIIIEPVAEGEIERVFFFFIMKIKKNLSLRNVFSIVSLTLLNQRFLHQIGCSKTKMIC